ncbi:hypothetical protein [Plantactinospora sp. KBS50]|uniref:hypothetical protein n=1 Tax=Plantactinospora sp. KBS50 TaxID=2024580 RepID=UPI000BAAC94B|nr:hypothetical protein [Plantactinospora sp. KBS50]ASW54342.1 hypothetical protein CIK06_09255 [Plantactinospora sp. KBS50]
MARSADSESATRAGRLKERVYLTFAALAVVLALASHEVSAGEALLTLVVTVTGTLLAVLVADVVSHIVVHATLPDERELRGMLRTSFGASGAVYLPLLFVAFAVSGRWSVALALRASTIALVSALVVIGYLAIRRLRLPTRQKLVVLLAEFVLGAAVVALERLAHGAA